VVDPACGGGRFLLGALAAQPRARLDGLDADAHAASVCRAALWIAADGQAPARIQVADPLADRALGGSGLPPGRFQRVVGNPPYRAARRGPLLQGDPQGYRQHFQTAEYQLDPYVLFLELGLQALAPGGELAMVVPGAWAANHHTGKLRSLVVGQYRLAEWIELPLDTFAAGVETVLMRVVHDGRTGRRVPVRSLRGVPRGALLPDPERPRAPLALARTPEDEALLAHSRGWATTLGDVAEITRGVNPYHHSTHSPAEIEAKVHHAAVPRTPAWEPELRGRDLAGPYRLWPGGEHWIRYGPWLKEPRDPRFHEGPRLLVRKVLGPTLCAVFLARRYVCDQSLYVVKPRPGQPWPLGALLACLNSSLLARLLRARLETTIPAGYGRLAAWMGRFRPQVKAQIAGGAARRRFWERVLEGQIGETFLAGREAEAERLLTASLTAGTVDEVGEVYLVGAGPGDPDLLTFRALRLMQKADVVLYDRLVAAPIVDLVRKEAERIHVGKERDRHTLPQSRINQLLIDLARSGKRVLRLKGGDPFIFGRGG
ncbi:MAG: N-6 DNA methylase, partial [Myxococcales bacterium]|nr:N-6 DNA methylase [Myxococcales bacterium]